MKRGVFKMNTNKAEKSLKDALGSLKEATELKANIEKSIKKTREQIKDLEEDLKEDLIELGHVDDDIEDAIKDIKKAQKQLQRVKGINNGQRLYASSVGKKASASGPSLNQVNH